MRECTKDVTCNYGFCGPVPCNCMSYFTLQSIALLSILYSPFPMSVFLQFSTGPQSSVYTGLYGCTQYFSMLCLDTALQVGSDCAGVELKRAFRL